MLRVLRQRAKHIIFTPLEDRNCWEPEALSAVARELDISSSVASDTQSALDASFKLVGERGWILATGSLHLIAPVRKALRPEARGHEIRIEEAGT
jgi:folylpolyglutamate synthase/dihydropteroate synthase